MVMTKFAAIAALVAVATSAAQGARVEHQVHRTLRQQGSANIIITFHKGTESVLESVHEQSFATRSAKTTSLVESLEAHAQETQTEVTAVLAQEATAVEYTRTKSFWISNQVFIEGASPALVQKLSALPSVATIAEEQLFYVDPIQVLDAPADNSTLSVEWGVDRIGAPAVWASGTTGQNAIVASIDTGVRGTHEILKNNFRGDYGWFDPEAQKPSPYDNNGHGTHTMGSIAGANGVGVAPGAKWMACKGCRTSSCPQSDLLACGEFMACPTDTNGNNKDCSKTPDVINNSWGGGQGSTKFKSMVDAWQAAGIIPVFSQGNSGPYCKTANSPGDLANVIGVGATDVNEGLASFSSKGPSVGGLMKPDVSAPGVAVRSSWNSADDGYNTISGTSMAGPHVTGAVGLLVSYKAGITYDEVKTLLTTTAATSLKPADRTCGGSVDGTFPNNQYGYGRISVAQAFTSLQVAQ